MKSSALWLCLFIGGLCGLWLVPSCDEPKPAPVQPCPPDGPCPAPMPDRPKQPKRPRRPWGPRAGFGRTSRVIGEPEPMVDLLAMPADHRKHNIASSGLGCCTFRSAEYCARWAGVTALYDLPEWMKQNGIAGGGTPSKQAEVIRRCAEARHLPVPVIYQYEGREPAEVAAVIRRILETGRPCGVTWQANHMLCCVYCDSERIGILDNNAPDRVQWYSYDDGIRRICQGGGGWVFALAAPGAPPPPLGTPRPRTASGCRCGPSCSKDCARGGECRCGRDNLDPAPEGIDGGIGLWRWPARERYWVGGQQVSRQEWEDDFPDDAGKLWLVVIGPQAQRSQALAAAGASVQGYRMQSADPSWWALQQGHVLTGLQVYLQTPDGRVLLRAQSLDGLSGKLRRSDPSYDPARDPDGSKPAAPGLPGPSKLRDLARKHGHKLAIGAGAGLAAWFLSQKQQEGQAAPVDVAPVPAPAAVPDAPAPAAQLHPYDQLALKIGHQAIERAIAPLAPSAGVSEAPKA